MIEDFSELKEDTHLQISRVKIISSKINVKKSLLRYIIVKLQKATEKEKRLLKAAKDKKDYLQRSHLDWVLAC